MDTNNDPFSRAMSQWDLETLYLDLASVKGKRLTPTEKKHLQGLGKKIAYYNILRDENRSIDANVEGN